MRDSYSDDCSSIELIAAELENEIGRTTAHVALAAATSLPTNVEAENRPAVRPAIRSCHLPIGVRVDLLAH